MNKLIALSAAGIILISGAANAKFKPESGGGWGPPGAVSTPTWQGPNPTGLGRALEGKKEPSSTGVNEARQETRDQHNNPRK